MDEYSMNKDDYVQIDKLDQDKYERSKRLGWFDVNKVKNTKLLVVGAGAIGNETCKNLVLSGYQHISLVDMDYVVNSNLNRCLFFSEEDAKQRRLKVEAIKEKILRLNPKVKLQIYKEKIETFSDDFIPSHNIVLGCLDNIATRLHLNSHCYYHDVPYVDAATLGLTGKVQVVIPPKTSCLECSLNRTHKKMMNVRMSCTGKNITFFEPKLAADINTTSIVSAVQVQEALKITHKRFSNIIRNMWYYDGNRNVSEVFEIEISPDCVNHH
jgi:molybdopterin/thiamine biosynthesis adenylyltransferase